MALPLLILVAGCARDSAGWPSLAPRRAEMRSTDADRTSAAQVAPTPVPSPAVVPAPEPPPAPVAAGPDPRPAWAKLKSRIAAGQATLERTLARAGGTRIGSEPWAAAELELSRAEQLGGTLDDLGERSAIGAELATTHTQIESAREALTRRIEAAKRALAR